MCIHINKENIDIMINYYDDEYLDRPFQEQSILKIMCDKVFKNGPSEICGRQPLKNLK